MSAKYKKLLGRANASKREKRIFNGFTPELREAIRINHQGNEPIQQTMERMIVKG